MSAIRKMGDRSKWSRKINEIIDELNAMKLRDSSSIKVSRTTGGTFVESVKVSGSGGGATNIPRWG